MWNKSFRMVCIKLKFGDNRHFSLPIPIPLYLFKELLECTLDTVEFTRLFVHKRTKHTVSCSIHSISELLKMLLKLLDSVGGFEPYDLVDVTAGNFRISVRIR